MFKSKSLPAALMFVDSVMPIDDIPKTSKRKSPFWAMMIDTTRLTMCSRIFTIWTLVQLSVSSRGDYDEQKDNIMHVSRCESKFCWLIDMMVLKSQVWTSYSLWYCVAIYLIISSPPPLPSLPPLPWTPPGYHHHHFDHHHHNDWRFCNFNCCWCKS